MFIRTRCMFVYNLLDNVIYIGSGLEWYNLGMESVKRKFVVKMRFPAWSITDARDILVPAGPKVYVFADLHLNEDPVIFELDLKQCRADRQQFISATALYSLPMN